MSIVAKTYFYYYSTIVKGNQRVNINTLVRNNQNNTRPAGKMENIQASPGVPGGRDYEISLYYD